MESDDVPALETRPQTRTPLLILTGLQPGAEARRNRETVSTVYSQSRAEIGENS